MSQIYERRSYINTFEPRVEFHIECCVDQMTGFYFLFSDFYILVSGFKLFNESFKRKFEMFQYKAALVITGTRKRTFRDRLYQEFGVESLADKSSSLAFFSFTKLNRDSFHPIVRLNIMLLVKERI